jgi:hypothetical protein
MKKSIIFLGLLAFFSCTDTTKTADASAKKEDTSQKDNNAKALYERNLDNLKRGITAFENKNLDDWAATVSDTTIWNSAEYGSSPAGKLEWRKSLASYNAEWDSLKLMYPDFLPGIDSATHQFDGSVRYYGIWQGVHKSGVRTSVNFYATYDFDKDGKIVNASEFFDVGGLINTLKPKKIIR